MTGKRRRMRDQREKEQVFLLLAGLHLQLPSPASVCEDHHDTQDGGNISRNREETRIKMLKRNTRDEESSSLTFFTHASSFPGISEHLLCNCEDASSSTSSVWH